MGTGTSLFPRAIMKSNWRSKVKPMTRKVKSSMAYVPAEKKAQRELGEVKTVMKRRTFLAALSGGFATAVLGKTTGAARPLTLDLRAPLRQAVSCIQNRMDPAAGYRPWFAVDVKDWIPTKLRHDVWDIGDMSGRFLEALVLARNMTAPTTDTLLAEQRIREFLNAQLGSEGLVVHEDRKGPDHMFSQGSALYGMVTDYDAGRDPALRRRIMALITGLDHHGRHQADYISFPDVATQFAPCAHMAAYQVLPIVRFYELSGESAALLYAERLSRWAFYHDPTVTAEGVITKTAWEGHLHAWMDTYSGIIRCARAGAGLDRKEVVTRSQKLYEWVKQNYTTPYGWVADSVGSETCETCTISSAMRLALELIKEGHTEYWNDIERFVRNQVVENQFRDVDHLGIQDPLTAQGLKGAFESYAAPNTLIAVRDGTIEGCCINGGIRCLFLAYQNVIHETAEVVRINLLLSHATPGIETISYLPHEGRFELYPQSAKTIWIRCPDGLNPDTVVVDGPAGLRHAIDRTGHALRISGAKPGARLVVTFEPGQHSNASVVATKKYDVKWRGDTVTQLTPPGRPYPIYQRDSLARLTRPLETRYEPYEQPRVQW